MKILRSLSAMRAWRAGLPASASVGFVPTMGALHAGHATLIERSRRENRSVVVSVFVNPIQFGPTEDFARYPRPWKKDVALLRRSKVDALFVPSAGALYAPDDATRVNVAGLTATLCGSPSARGPEHFVGVATVVAKLFHLVRPTRSYFGMKDFQQLRVIEQMNQDLRFGVQIVRCPTVREPDGLAMSSRNAYLSTEDRARAPRLYAALQAGGKLLASPPSFDSARVRAAVAAGLSDERAFQIDYVEIVSPITLQPSSGQLPALLAAAVKLGQTRLIDNILVKNYRA